MAIKKNDLEFYDLRADYWWNEDTDIYALYHLNKPRFVFFNRYVVDWEGLKVLDVGCGGGFSCEFMADMGVSVYGLDQSKKCINAAKKHALESGFTIDYSWGLAEKMPYADNTFDAVICVDVLEHVQSVPSVIAEVSRVLKPEGLFFFDTINRTFRSKLMMIWLMENILGEIPKGVHDWNKFVKPEELGHMLQDQGFSDLEFKGFDIFGEALRLNLSSYLAYKRTNKVKVTINEDISINYIGKATKLVH
jgi:2-polyprenyl-6-hydroxyphenyl methylase / 3-demethylubiquinone-9 3-methyltransferase